MPTRSALAKERQTDLIPDTSLLAQYAAYIQERGGCSDPERLEFLCRAYTQTALRIARCNPSPTDCAVKCAFASSLLQDLPVRMEMLFPEPGSSEGQKAIKKEREEFRRLVRSLTELLLG